MITLTILLLTISISWLVTCGLVYILCLCFGLAFSWAVATGIWIVIAILKSIFN